MQFFVLVTLSVLVVGVLCSHESEQVHRDSFLKFALKHGRNISDPHEHDRRLAMYSKRKTMIDQHNEEALRGLHTFILAENEFMDRLEEELIHLFGAVIPRSMETAAAHVDVRLTLASVDLRNDKCMPPVKQQGKCGSCWAFAAVAPLEYKHCKKTDLQTSLRSEEQLISCSKESCGGGFYTTAWNYIKSAGGIMSSTSFPYTAAKSTCKFSASKVVTKVSSSTLVGNSESAIAAAIAQHGPVAVSVHVNSKFMHYKSGIFNDHNCPTSHANHAVVAVGYGTDAKAGHYWIIRNSWGHNWGDNGYILMKRGVKMCAFCCGAYVNID